MSYSQYEVTFGKGVLEYLETYAARSFSASHRVGILLHKAEHFDTSGIENCNAQTEIRSVGQHQVLPLRNGSLYAFIELTKSHRCGEIFFATEVDYLGDLRRAWQHVHDHFGYDSGPSGYRMAYWV